MSPTSLSVRHLPEVCKTSIFTVTSYTYKLRASETGWLPLVTTVTYGYIWLHIHMVTGGYIWLQATVLNLPDETLYERGARDDQLPT